MTGPQQLQHSALKKLRVTCRTCGESESFYSTLSVDGFKADHAGHDVFDGDEDPTLSKVEETKPVSEEQSSSVGEPQAIENVMGAGLMLSLVAESFEGEKTPESKPEGLEDMQLFETSTFARTDGGSIAHPQGLETGQTAMQLVSATAAARVEFEASTQPPLDQTTMRQSQALELVHPPAPEPQPAVNTEEERLEAIPQEVITRTGEEKPEEYLLVSKSWYIQGGAGNRTEAARISKVLKAFRWKVVPTYTIGIILDDMLSIESSTEEISRALLTAIENEGYRLAAVTTDQGKPVAWFKRVLTETSALPDPT